MAKKNTPQKKLLEKKSERESEQECESEPEPEPEPVQEPKYDDASYNSFETIRDFFLNVITTFVSGSVFSWLSLKRLMVELQGREPEWEEQYYYTFAGFFFISLVAWIFYEYIIHGRNILCIIYSFMRYRCKHCRLWKLFSNQDPHDDDDDDDDDDNDDDDDDDDNVPKGEKLVKKTKKRQPQPSFGRSRIIVRRRS